MVKQWLIPLFIIFSSLSIDFAAHNSNAPMADANRRSILPAAKTETADPCVVVFYELVISSDETLHPPQWAHIAEKIPSENPFCKKE